LYTFLKSVNAKGRPLDALRTAADTLPDNSRASS
jgi:hypothetical protein